MADHYDKQRANVQTKGITACLAGLTRTDNPYIITTPLGRKWARIWLEAFTQAELGLTCDECGKLLNKKSLQIEYRNGFNYYYCGTCIVIEERLAPKTTVLVVK